ncbi:MAG: asparagine synthase (glutamine-hydrolyzing) [Bacilli bacterium]|nr:asparagine synthase (glutamine-hydrolyzing) [Bacilli bacterium]
MCGIVGFVSNAKSKKRIIKNMADRIKHRGPDDESYFISDEIALAHRRLAIIDIENGKQPMFNDDNTYCIIFNGEIYNYKNLKLELEKKGYKFKTASDTEVILHGYEEWGSNLPKRLRGMFAFAIYNIKDNTLFLARDPFGIKPLYYYFNDQVFMFSSEIKSFLEHPDFNKELNEELIGPYMSFSFTPTNETFFKGVYRVEPGTTLTYKNGDITIDRYYDLTFDEKLKEYDDYVSDIATVMEDSVKHHMISDVEVGSFLSSGIDSSYIVSLAKPDRTYTVGYDIPKYNEIDYALDLTDKLGINNTSKKITKKEYMKILPDIMYYMDEPTSDPAAVALYFVAELASKDLKVVLSGEGADEFFGGYNYYREEVDFKFYNKIPYFIRHAISSICKLLPEVRGVNFLIRRGERLENNYIGVNKVYSEKEIKKILKVPYKLSNKDITKSIYKKYEDKSNITKMQAIDINFWLIKDILQKADRMTMAHSLEGRVPFVDVEVFKVASSLVDSAKVNKENTKVALRDAAATAIPNESYKKKKLGFPVPIRDWIKENDFYREIKKVFNSKECKRFFNNEYMLKLLEEHKTGKKDNYRKIWNIYCFLKWYQVYFVNI